MNKGYLWEMVMFTLGGTTGTTGMRGYFLARANATTGQIDGPGFDTTTFTKWNDVSKILKGVAHKAANEEMVRTNELGFQHLNSYFWEAPNTGPNMMGLGINNNDHAFARPKFGKLLDPKAGKWSENNYAMLEKYLNAFFKKKQWSTKNDVHSVKAMTTRMLFEIHLGREITEEQAVEFINFQSSALLAIATPYYFHHIFGSTLGAWLTTYCFKPIQDKRLEYFQTFSENLMVHLPVEDFKDLSEKEKQLITSSVMDSLLFAGGLSISGVLQMCVGLLVDSVGSDVSPAGPDEWRWVFFS